MIPWKISINLMWWGWGAGFRLVVNFGLLSLTFLTSRKRSGGFWSIRSYILTGGFGDKRSSGARTFLTDSRHGNLNFRLVIYFRFLSGFCFRSHFYIRDSGETTCVCDLRTMEEVGSTWLTSLELVTTGVGSVSRAARLEADSHHRMSGCCDLRTLLDDVVSIVLLEIRYLLASNRRKFCVGKFLKLETIPSPTQNGNGKLTRSQNYLCKISLVRRFLLYLLSQPINYRDKMTKINFPNYLIIFHRKKLSPQSKSAGEFW